MKYSFFVYLSFVTKHLVQDVYSMSSRKSSFEDIVKILVNARDKYYSGSPIMSDREFDELEDRLRREDPSNSYFKTVGAAVKSGERKKVKHEIPMGSLNKAQNEGDLSKWIKSLGRSLGNAAFLISDKLDGISIDLKYKNGRLVNAVTRGDGEYGEDITENVACMRGVPKTVQDFTGHIRGEIVILKDDFKSHFQGESSPRNSAAGAAKRLDNSKARYCTVICYRILGKEFDKRSEEIFYLKDRGFNIPNVHFADNLSEIQSIYNWYINVSRDTLNYEIDGLVIELNDNNKALEVLSDHFHPEHSIAYKFPHQQAETYIRNIVWQVGKTGRITPVGIFDQVNVAGANITKASLATASFVAQMKLRVGDKILVSRRNDVIPKIERVIEHSKDKLFKIPESCPNCHSQISIEGEYLVCRNNECSDKVEGLVLGWLRKIGVLEWGDAIIEELQYEGVVTKIPDLYKITKTQLAEFVGDKRAATMMGELNAKKDLPLHVFIGSLGIEGISRSNAKTIVDAGYDTLEEMFEADIDDISYIHGMGLKRAENFVDGLNDNYENIKELLRLGITIQKPKSGNLNGKSFCMTGFRDANLAEAIERAGGTIKSSVSQGLNFLIQKDVNSISEKTKKAFSYGTEIISIEKAREMAGK